MGEGVKISIPEHENVQQVSVMLSRENDRGMWVEVLSGSSPCINLKMASR
jgi:hypothetical protein